MFWRAGKLASSNTGRAAEVRKLPKYDEAGELKLVAQVGFVRTLLCLALWLFAFGVTATNSHAENRILLLNSSPSLERAVEQALEPWAMQTEGVREAVPTGGSDSLRQRAMSLSEQYQARAVVWISDTDGAAILSIYDSREQRVVLRKLANRPPYDEVSAASVALSIKTILLHREADRKTESRSRPPDSSVANDLDPAKLPEMISERRTHGWIFDSQIMARHSLANDDSYQSRLVLGGGYRWPSFSLTLLAAFGPGREIKDNNFQGNYTDLAVRAQLGYHLGSANWVLQPLLALTAHRSQLKGRVDGVGASVQRINPSLDFGVRVGRKFAPIEIGIQTQMSAYTRSQRYLLQGQLLLDLPAFEVTAGLFARLTIP